MATNELLLTSSLSSSMPLVNKGKVRDIYQINPSTLLIITTDRISAFDVTLATGIPSKGALLTLISAHWSRILPTLIPNLRTHLLTLDLPAQMPPAQHPTYRHRSMQVLKLTPFKIEAIVRGYLTREAWVSYQHDHTVSGIPLPAGLRESEAIPYGPIYTPSTKADAPGEHDEDISEAQATALVGSSKHAERIKELSLAIYRAAHAYAWARGLILADTKFEFGLEEGSGEVVLADEILTPER